MMILSPLHSHNKCSTCCCCELAVQRYRSILQCGRALKKYTSAVHSQSMFAGTKTTVFFDCNEPNSQTIELR